MRENLKNIKGICIIIALVIMTSTILSPAVPAGAASKYIRVDDFIKQLVQVTKIEVNTSADNPYIDAAITAGIIKSGDFKNYTSNITRTDAAVLLNRADEYLHGDTVKADLLKFVLKKRISDIKKVSEGKREAVAKCFAKGIIKGFFNGYYRQNRKFSGSDYITKTSAKATINLVVNPNKRAKISPDGELIRTTNLPKNASKYEYILACYPNKFYEKKFEFMLGNGWEKLAYMNYYAYPVQMKKRKFKTWNDEWPLSEEMDKYMNDWKTKAETYLKYVFNVDYRTVDDKWIKGLASCYANSNIDQAADIKKYYIKDMKKNKVIVESSIVAVEPSSFYEDNDYCIRAYVRYKVTAKNIEVNQSDLIYSQYPYLKNLKNGVWREGVFDIRLGTNNGYQGDGAYFAINDMTRFFDE